MDQQVQLTPLAQAQAVAPAIADAAGAIEQQRRITPEVMEKLYESSLLRMFVPRSAGGDEVAPVPAMAAIEEISKHDASVGWNLFVANAAALIAPYLPPETARLVFGGPKALVAWGPPNQHVITTVPGGYRVSGSWDFASGCRHATWMGAHGFVQEADGRRRCDSAGSPIVLTVLFPADKAVLLDDWNVVGMRGTGSESYRVEDVFVPEAHSGRRGDPTLCREHGPLYAFTMQSLYSAGVAAVALGVARAMFDALTALGARKAPRGLQRLADRPTFQAGIARMEARLGAARAYLHTTLNEIYDGAGGAPIDIPDRARVRLAATHAIHESIAAADHAYKQAGVDAIFPGRPFERRFRDIHTLSQQIQSRESHYERIGQVLLGDPPADFL